MLINSVSLMIFREHRREPKKKGNFEHPLVDPFLPLRSSKFRLNCFLPLNETEHHKLNNRSPSLRLFSPGLRRLLNATLWRKRFSTFACISCSFGFHDEALGASSINYLCTFRMNINPTKKLFLFTLCATFFFVFPRDLLLHQIIPN